MQGHLKGVYVCKCITLNSLTTSTGPVSYDHEQVQGVGVEAGMGSRDAYGWQLP